MYLLTIYVVKVCQQWRFVTARTTLSLLLTTCETNLYLKEMNIKANTASKTAKNVVAVSACIFPSVLFEQTFSQVGRFVIPCVHVVLMYCKERKVPCGEGGFCLSLEGGLVMLSAAGGGLLL